MKGLNSDSSDEIQVETIEFVEFEELVEVDVKEFKDQAGMASEEEGMFELDDV